MHKYGQFCPVAKACELFAERWTPLIVRELLCGSHHFNELQRGLPLISRTLLSQRLKELEDAGAIERRAKSKGQGWEYHLTAAGEEFREVVEHLGKWGQRWAQRQIDPNDLDAGFLMWDLHRRLHLDRLPSHRVVMQFDFRGMPKNKKGNRRFWLVVTRPEVELCLTNPGYEIDLVVDADLGALARVWLGDIRLTDAVRSGLITIDGPRKLIEAFPAWLGLSGFAGVERPLQTAAR